MTTALPAPWWLAIHAGWLSELPARALAAGCSANITGDVALFLGCCSQEYQRALTPAVVELRLRHELPPDLAAWVLARWSAPAGTPATPEQQEDILDRATEAAVALTISPP